MKKIDYLTALENFISDIQKYPDTLNSDITPALKEICSVLKITKIEMYAYDNEAAEHLNIYKYFCFFGKGHSVSENDVCLNKRFTTGDENIAIYRIWSADDYSWDKTEEHRIDIMLDILTFSHAKSRLIGIAHHLTFFDTELDMFNLRQFMKCVKILYKAEQTYDKIYAVYDEVGNPTCSHELATFLVGFIQLHKYEEIPCGIYNFTEEHMVSRYEFAKEIASLSAAGPARQYSIFPISQKECYKQYKLKAPRSYSCILSNKKINEYNDFFIRSDHYQLIRYCINHDRVKNLENLY